MEAVTEIEGTVENIIFANAEGTFTVFKLKPSRETGLVNATVGAPAPLVGEQVKLVGAWITHARFGEQFKAGAIMRVAPATVAGIERFLASGAIKGIGVSMAKRLVGKFGQDTLSIIESQPDKLREISGIGAKKAAAIHAAYSAQAELREVMLFLETHGVSGAYAGKIYAKYSSFSLDMLKSDPYRLAREIDGIGFRTADQIASAAGISKVSEERIAAGIDFALLQVSGAGHCCVPEEALIAQAAKLLLVDRGEVSPVLKKMLRAGSLCTECDGAETLIYPRHLYYAEKMTAERLLYLKGKANRLDDSEAAAQVDAWEKESGLTLAQNQKAAITSALQHGVLVITGGPGTGKTTVIKGIIAVLERQGMRVLLGAPTGRAAKRLSEATGKKAATVHRLLESSGTDEGLPVFLRDTDAPLDADVIILDEVSMMDILLMRYFLEAVLKGCRVILVGDADQLPSVGPGSVLKDILRSGVIPFVCLREIFRQQGQGMIAINAHGINCGKLPDCGSGDDFEFREIAESGAVAAEIVKLCTKELPGQGYDIMRDVQVLSPMHRLDCGVENLNRLLQEALNPPEEGKAALSHLGQVFQCGDKVMQIRNNYTKNVFNGDIGFILDIEAEKATIRYLDADVVYEKNELAEIRLAYAMSVHKSQGSEYPVVIMPLVAGHHVMLQRNLLYTAVTRAKAKVVLLGSKAALSTAVYNDKMRKRYSLLAQRLKNHGE